MKKAKEEIKEEREEREVEIAEATAARRKLRIIQSYGPYKLGDVVSLAPRRREFLVANGFAKLEK